MIKNSQHINRIIWLWLPTLLIRCHFTYCKASNIISVRVYQYKSIDTKFRRNPLKRLLKDTAFSFNNTFYKRKDHVSFWSWLGLVLANIIMTELKIKIVEPLMSFRKITFYTGFVVNTLHFTKEENMNYIFPNLTPFILVFNLR